MRSPLVPLLIGLAFIGAAIGIQRQQQALQRADVRDIAGLHAELDSVRAAAALAAAGPDSVRLVQSVGEHAMVAAAMPPHLMEWRSSYSE